jgi:phosphotransferase system  glucose/maltose/N-acetylglucosamine-specific IIC component
VTKLSQEKPSLVDILQKNRSFVLAILGLPVVGMTIAFALILYKKPDNMIIALAVIFFLAIQYIIMIYFFMKRIDSMTNQKKDDSQIEEAKELSMVDQNNIATENILAPEEERVLPEEKK